MSGNRSWRRHFIIQALVTLGLLFFCVLVFLWEGQAFIQEQDIEGDLLLFWPNAQTTLNLQNGCPPNEPLTNWGPCWDDAATDAATRWNTAGSQFRFSFQSPPVAVIPCPPPDGLNTSSFRPTRCGFRFGDALAVTLLFSDPNTGRFLDTDTVFDANRQWSTYSGPLQRNAQGVIVYDFHRVAIHEFGHVLGLDHPDDFGQTVPAIMNSRVSNLDDLQADDIAGIGAIYPQTTPAPQGVLENPQAGKPVSGLSLISGWVCTANRVDLVLDGIGMQAAYGTPRADTRSICGDDNNGFGFLMNWNILGEGSHTVVALADGLEFARTTFTVTTFGVEFLTGASGRFPISFNGRNVIIEWQESLQNFVIVETQ